MSACKLIRLFSHFALLYSHEFFLSSDLHFNKASDASYITWKYYIINVMFIHLHLSVLPQASENHQVWTQGVPWLVSISVLCLLICLLWIIWNPPTEPYNCATAMHWQGLQGNNVAYYYPCLICHLLPVIIHSLTFLWVTPSCAFHFDNVTIPLVWMTDVNVMYKRWMFPSFGIFSPISNHVCCRLYCLNAEWSVYSVYKTLTFHIVHSSIHSSS